MSEQAHVESVPPLPDEVVAYVRAQRQAGRWVGVVAVDLIPPSEGNGRDVLSVQVTGDDGGDYRIMSFRGLNDRDAGPVAELMKLGNSLMVASVAGVSEEIGKRGFQRESFIDSLKAALEARRQNPDG